MGLLNKRTLDTEGLAWAAGLDDKIYKLHRAYSVLRDDEEKLLATTEKKKPVWPWIVGGGAALLLVVILGGVQLADSRKAKAASGKKKDKSEK